MNLGTSEAILFLIGQVILAAAIWGGIRADIKSMHSQLSEIKRSADRAHERIDDFISGRRTTNHREARDE